MRQTRIPALFLLFTLLLVLCVPSLAAYAQEVQFPIDRHNDPMQMVNIQGSIYAYTNQNKLYLLDSAYQPSLMCKDLPMGLVFLQGPELTALDTKSGTIYRFVHAGNAMTYSAYKQLNLDDLQSIQSGDVLKGIVTSNLLCLMVGRIDVSDETSVFTFDLESGKLNPGRITDVSDMCGYQPGKILILRTLDYEILAADVTAMQTETHIDAPGAYGLTGLCYDSGSDTICVMSGMVVYASRQGMPFEPCGYMDSKSSLAIHTVLPNEYTYIALLFSHQLSVCNFTSFEDARPVHMIGGGPVGGMVSDYFQANPGTPVLYDEYMPDQYIPKMLLYSPEEADIFIVSTDNGIYNGILNKGHALDLNQAEAVTKAVADMHPDIRDKVTKDGKIYGLPIDVACTTMLYDRGLFQELGLKVPNTWLELMDLMIELAQRDDICLMKKPYYGASASETVLTLMMNAYFNAASAGNPGLAYDPATFQSLLEKWEEMDSVLDRAGERPVKEDQKALFKPDLPGWPKFSAGRLAGFSILPLAFSPGGEKYAPASLSVMMINPASKHREEALRFLEYYAKNLPAYYRIYLCPGENAPAPIPSTVKEMAKNEQIIAQLTQQWDSSAGEEQARLGELLDYYKKDLTYMQEHSLAMTPEDIADYRRIADNMIFGLNGAGYIYMDKVYNDTLQLFKDHTANSKILSNYITYRWSVESLSQ